MNAMIKAQEIHVAEAPASKPAPGAALALRDLCRIYGSDLLAVDNVNLTVEGGEFVTLLGPSGSGKTTTLKMIAGFEHPESGSITLDGREIAGVAPHKRDIGMVFQNYALFPHMTVFDNIAFPLKMRGKSAREIEALVAEALDLVQLSKLGKRFPKQLSGGQQQRVALARALVFRPPLLLMDEPLGALDRQLRKSVQQELKRITRSLGITVIFVTHDQEEALYLSDRIALMNHGRIVQVGAPEALYSKPNSRFVAEFLGESNFLTGRIDAIEGGIARVVLPDGQAVRGVPIDPIAIGSEAHVLVRPERLTINRGMEAEATGLNVLTGTIEMRNFIGNAREYEIIAAGQTLSAHLQLRSQMDVFEPNEIVTLSVAERDCLIFPAEAR
jgi:spermidine/putrescine ABC transporter ATP-binding subunit